VTGKSFTTPQVAATAGEAVLYAAEATPSGLYTSLKGPASAPSGGAYSFQFTNTLPSAGQSFKFGTVSSRIVPLEYTTYAELSGATFTGAVQLPSAYLALGADPADQGAIRLANAAVIAWEDATELTLTHVDNTGLALNGDLSLVNLTYTGTLTGPASTDPYALLNSSSGTDFYLQADSDGSQIQINTSGTVDTGLIAEWDTTGLLSLGKASTLAGSIDFHNATNANTAKIQGGVTSASYTMTLPTAAPGGANYLLNCDADGTMGTLQPSAAVEAVRSPRLRKQTPVWVMPTL